MTQVPSNSGEKNTASDHPAMTLDANVEAIRQDLLCPQCEYNLRGLSGSVVNCPECGLPCDIAKLIANRWTKPWYKAPGLNRLAWPSIVLMLLLLCGPLSLLVISSTFGNPSSRLGLGALGISLVIYILLMIPAWRLFDGVKGIFLAWLLHIVLVGYLVGLIGSGLVLIRLVTSMSTWGFTFMVISAVLLLFFVGLIVLARWLDRFVAQQCIKRYLERSAHAL